MPRIAKQSKSEIADVLSTVFETHGYAGASLAMLAEVSGLSKASLYHHFPRGKEDMAAHILGRAGARLQKHVLAPLQQSGTPCGRLQSSFQGVALYYDHEVPVCLMNSLMLGEGFELFGRQVVEAMSIWRKALESVHSEMASGADSKVWATSVIERIQGALILCKLEQSRLPLEACLSSLGHQLPA